MAWYSPAEAAGHTNLSLDTLRYYEREGLIGPVRRDSGGRRRYSDGDLAWLDVVTCLRRSGMGIADLRRFVGVLRDGAAASTEPVAMLRMHRERLVEDIEQIRAAVSVIDGKIDHYERVAAADSRSSA